MNLNSIIIQEKRSFCFTTKDIKLKINKMNIYKKGKNDLQPEDLSHIARPKRGDLPSQFLLLKYQQYYYALISKYIDVYKQYIKPLEMYFQGIKEGEFFIISQDCPQL